MNQERPSGVFDARLRFWLLSGLLSGMGLLLLALLILTQTTWGHERVLGFTLRQAAAQLNGTLVIERLDGNLLIGARLYGLALRGPDDEPFILADSAYVEYNLRTIVGEEIVLDRLVLYDAQIFLSRMPGEEFWNYDRILGDTLPPIDPVEPRRPIVVRSASVLAGDVTVQLPWEPDAALSPAEQRREIAAALADTSQVLVHEVPGGYLQTIRISNADADLLRIASAPDELGGTSLRIERFAGDLQVFREPLRIRHGFGDIHYLDEVLSFQLPQVLFGSSRVSGLGSIGFGDEDGPRLDISLRVDTVAFADLQWLYPPLPQEGGGSLSLLIETRPEGTLYLARDLDVVAPGTRLWGSFGLIVNEAFEFVDVNLDADPLRIATVEQLLPIELPVVGLQIGGVQIRQPAS